MSFTICRGRPVTISPASFDILAPYLAEITLLVRSYPVDEKRAAAVVTGERSSITAAQTSAGPEKRPIVWSSRHQSRAPTIAKNSPDESVVFDDSDSPTAREPVPRPGKACAVAPNPALETDRGEEKNEEEQGAEQEHIDHRRASSQWEEVPRPSSSSPPATEPPIGSLTYQKIQVYGKAKRGSSSSQGGAIRFVFTFLIVLFRTTPDFSTQVPRVDSSPTNVNESAQTVVAHEPPAPLPPRQEEVAPSSSQPTAEDPRFKITVEGPGQDDRGEFNTRGGHAVRKVLMGACRTFGLDHHRAELYLCEELGDDCETQVLCDVNATIAAAGVKPGDRLIVKMIAESR
ncbi:hypothetical protein FISHEDRAFT_70705 [Fistulina hepatica ATCC 64428]|uniref:Uncharacterized protein n=1 Tax=Fistulina hepatica ATCC 64428 TaxID=1128425 RepID=A0A0D7AL07_9AGAR|nr:hypothetical protein FISHEDRAFT_70705 [Fistulina hepatica ATCC 64428]